MTVSGDKIAPLNGEATLASPARQHRRCLTWNIQWGKGEDGRVDLDRVAQVIRATDADIVCLQEVCRNFIGNTGDTEPDQVEGLRRRLPGYEVEFGAATHLRIEGETCQFGNLILSRWPVIAVANHLLPRPAVAGQESARSALELLVAGPWGPLRVITTHLEYNSPEQRLAQATYLLERHREVCDWATRPPTTPSPSHNRTPLRGIPRPASTLLCGDFNAPPHDDAIRLLTKGTSGMAMPLLDAWRHLYPERPHPPTLGLHTPGRDPGEAVCYDFVLLTADLAARACALQSDPDCAASDHQPLVLTLDEGVAPTA